MTATVQAFGARPAFHGGGGQVRAKRVKLVDATQAAYGTALYSQNFVTLATDGSLAAYDGTGSGYNLGIYGVLAGFEYTDSSSKPVKANFLPASPTGITNVYAWVYTDLGIVYEIATNASIAATAMGDQLTTITTPSAGSTLTGLGASYASGALAGANAQGVLRIVDIALTQDNDWGDAKTVVQVQICGAQTLAVKVAI
jgi:hypothetical protein